MASWEDEKDRKREKIGSAKFARICKWSYHMLPKFNPYDSEYYDLVKHNLVAISENRVRANFSWKESQTVQVDFTKYLTLMVASLERKVPAFYLLILREGIYGMEPATLSPNIEAFLQGRTDRPNDRRAAMNVPKKNFVLLCEATECFAGELNHSRNFR